MVTRNTSFCERRKEAIKKQELYAKAKVHVMNFSDKRNNYIMGFWE